MAEERIDMEAEDNGGDRVLRLEIVPEYGTTGNDAMVVEQEAVRLISVPCKVLGAKSGVFQMMFSLSTTEREVTIKFTIAEEQSFVQPVQHMNGKSWRLIGLDAEAFFNLLAMAEQYDGKECKKFCCAQLKRFMSEEHAVRYLQLDQLNHLLPREEELQSLTECVIQYLGKITVSLHDEIKQYFVSQYKEIDKFEEKLINFPLNIVEAIISSDDLEVTSEDVFYDFLCKWATAQYMYIPDRLAVLGQLVTRIRFRYMSFEALKRFSRSRYFDPNVVQPLVMDALLFKSDQQDQRPRGNVNANQRTYKYRPIKVVKFQVSQQPSCVVYFELPHTLCQSMLADHVYSEKFQLGCHELYLFAARQRQQGEVSFGLFLELTTNNVIDVDYEFAARARPLGFFKVLHRSSCSLAEGNKVGLKNLFGTTWNSFIAEDGEYFCGGALHLRVEIKMRE